MSEIRRAFRECHRLVERPGPSVLMRQNDGFSQPKPCRGRIGRVTSGFTKTAHRLIEPSIQHQYLAQTVVSGSIVRFNLDRTPELAPGQRDPPLALQHVAKVDVCVREVWVQFTPDERIQMRENLLASTREVAEAAGGFLGIASISAAEREMLDDLERIFD